MRAAPAPGLARLSAWIYAPAAEFRRRVAGEGWEVIAWHDHAGTQAALVCTGDWCALVFRGTQVTGGRWRQRVIDAATNLRVWPGLWQGPGRAHSGYSRALSWVSWPAREMAENVPSDMPLYVTGHSLGGVLASLYAAWVTAGGADAHRIAGLVTFGAPRGAASSAYAGLAERAPIWRYAVCGDFAPHWPPVPGYAHPGEAIRLRARRWWHGPLRRHDVNGYLEMVRSADDDTTA